MLFKNAKPEALPSPNELKESYLKVVSTKNLPKANELKDAILDALARKNSPETLSMLREIAEKDKAATGNIVKVMTKFPVAENLPLFIKGLETANPATTFDLLEAIRKTPSKPKPEDGTAFRAVLLSASKLQETQRWKAIEVLQHWTNNKSFGSNKGDWRRELPLWGRWFSQAFPKEASLPDLAAEPKVESKYQYDELLKLVESQKGDAKKGRVVYEKAQCIKCHQHGEVGIGVGPDLSTLGKRFKRAEILEATYYPSKVISDQFRSSTVVLLDGKRFDGLLAENGDNFTMILQDATKVNFTKGDIEKRFESLISVMPDKLLDALSKEEIVDLFAFLETVVEERKK
jgi:putative heme-binding domain-containing protein